MKQSARRVVMGLWAFMALAACTTDSARPDSGAAACGVEGGSACCGGDGSETPCCGEDLVIDVDPGPSFLAETSFFAVTGELGAGTFTSIELADANPPPTAACGARCVYHSTWIFTQGAGETTRIDSSLPVEDLSWLAGQDVTGAHSAYDLALSDESGRLLVWQRHQDPSPTMDPALSLELTGAPSALPFSLGVRTAPTEAFCRNWTSPCWLHDVHYLDVTVAGATHSLGPGESLEFVADGLRYRVTDRLLASRSRLAVAQCADYGRESWSFDVVALGPAS